MPCTSSISGRFLLLGAILLLTSCGDSTSPNVCGGAEQNGVCLYVVSLEPSYQGALTNNVDAIQGTCGTTAEPFFDHQIAVVFNAVTLGATSNTTQITINRYTITYTLNPTSVDPGPATIPSYEGLPNVVVPTDGTTSIDLNLLLTSQRDNFQTLPGYVGLWPAYTASYTFYGLDEYGRPVRIGGTTEFTIGDYDNC